MPKGHYPSLEKARKQLKNHPCLTASERHVIEHVLSPLAGQRNILMHMPAPEMLSATDTAIALLSLLHIIRRRTGFDTKKLFGQIPPIEQAIVEEIGWHKLDTWFRVAEQLVKEEHGDGYVRSCNYCGAIAVPADLPCQACFEPASRSTE